MRNEWTHTFFYNVRSLRACYAIITFGLSQGVMNKSTETVVTVESKCGKLDYNMKARNEIKRQALNPCFEF